MKNGRIALRGASASNARRLHALISENMQEGHLLPRTLSEITAHAERFVVAFRGTRIVGCAELAPLSPHVAEIRSLAVDRRVRGKGAVTCPLFRRCGQYAMETTLDEVRERPAESTTIALRLA
jgi:N-acetylglutamate synthase-like GNAT family acetyltransferase